MEMTDSVVIRLLGEKNEQAFERAFKEHFKSLHGYAFSIVRDEAAAEEMVQNVFFKLWERADTLNIAPPLAAYLYRAVHNESINHLKHEKVKRSWETDRKRVAAGAHEVGGLHLQAREFDERLQEAMNALPEQCRTIFQLSRFEELRYREIAEKLRISVKTVENQMGKALRIMREQLAEFLPILIISVLNLN